jgi:hypothetical protein
MRLGILLVFLIPVCICSASAKSVKASHQYRKDVKGADVSYLLILVANDITAVWFWH